MLRNAGAHDVSGVLVGGYFGTWLTPRQAAMVTLSAADLKAMGAGLGCGAIAALHSDTCPLAELARVTRWFASQSAGQCGVCVHGLPAIAGGVEHMAERRATATASAEPRPGAGSTWSRAAARASCPTARSAS